MSTMILNADAIVKTLSYTMNEEMKVAAEPVIAKALAEIETVMRRRMGEMLIAMINQDMNVFRQGTDLHITVRQAARSAY